VGAAAGYYLAKEGAILVGIIDRQGGLISVEGYGLHEVRQFFLHRKGNQLAAPGMISFDEVNTQIWNMPCDVFVPAAASRLVTRKQTEQLVAAGCQVVSCGANVPFADPEIFYGEIARYADAHMAVIPDFIANCGMARVFAYLMQDNISLHDEDIFGDVSSVIGNALHKVLERNGNQDTGLTATAYEIALAQL